ncbi:hypothetical protein PHYSODRAFT_531583 [Phytophthora sojae]|uniref:Uncharacterized protein n=1 Tax=Phytophthora sojae (strain P6497) TaxID=1094619 RepID=G5AD29_PHYSP|nr:hypothetical protein PHYSODRAFT_531583 [Phytophthora sojae]EGZ06083.1 hypothetical protein PHYSODRAFT_531583 [Phytophthora sojae]|eukprot:XP_009537980.1 hypothetical protein PHYSODRAFT_531583 [Phytophthora sojae]
MKTSNSTDEERQSILDEILIRCSNLVLSSGSYTDLAKRWGCYPSTISRIWHAYCAARVAGSPINAGGPLLWPFMGDPSHAGSPMNGQRSRKAKNSGSRGEATQKLRRCLCKIARWFCVLPQSPASPGTW